MNKLFKEPLFHFLLIGAGLFLIYEWMNTEKPADRETILITEFEVERLLSSYEKNWGQKPDSLSLTKLLDEYVRSEIFYREALEMNLEHNDEIIKRRLRQKYEFLVKDLSEQDDPETQDLEEFYHKHQENYQSERKLSFSHIYFSPDKRKYPRKDAEKVRKVLGETRGEDAKNYGDDFHLQTFYAKRTYRDIVQNYGKKFSDTLFSKSSLGWQEPIASGYGFHVVYISDIEDSKVLPFEQVQLQVKEDWKNAALTDFNEELYKSLQNKYEVIHEHNYFE